MLEIVENELPFLPTRKALAYFELEIEILERFATFLDNHVELDGQKITARAFKKIIQTSTSL